MKTQQATLTTFSIPQSKGTTFNIKSTINKYLYHWPLFVIGLVISMAGLIFFLKTTKPVYEVNATIMIMDESKKQNQAASPLHEIELVNTSRIIENEIEVFKSKELIGQVVKELDLQIGYQKVDGIFSEDLYRQGPVKFTLLREGDLKKPGGVDLTIHNKESFFINMPDGSAKEFNFKDTFTNKFGVWKLEPTKNLEEFEGERIKISITDPESAALAFQKKLVVNLSNKLSTTVILTIDDEVPQRGKDVLNRIIFNYNLAGTVERNRETKNTLDFIDQRLASLSEELHSTEKGIEVFKSNRGLTDISSDSKIRLENMQANDTRLNEVNVQLSVVEGIEKYINSPQSSGRIPTTLGIDDPALRSMIEKLSQLQLQREKLLATTPETNPDFEPINRQIVVTKASIRESVQNIKSSLQSSQEKLQSFNTSFESSIRNIPVAERQYIGIKRQQAIKESLYTYLLQKREEISVRYVSTISDNRIVDHAYSGQPKKTQKSMALAAAILLGFGLPVGLIYVRNLLSPKVKEPNDIKEVLDLPIVAELPFEKSHEAIAVHSNRATAISEQFRSLRIRLGQIAGNNDNGRVTLVTSSVSGEGKSFVSTNLAITMALSGRKTILLELDLRKPRLQQMFGLAGNGWGIADYLEGRASLKEVIQNSGKDGNLDIICSGNDVLNPSELLETNALSNLIASLRLIYDDIIIDSPPIHLVSDAVIISKFANVTLFMIRQGYTEKDELAFIKEIHEQKQLSDIHLIFNGIQRLKYGYGYDYDINYYNAGKQKNLTGLFSDFSARF
jgi:tyrosine-protein kinase Etk/Wzc